MNEALRPQQLSTEKAEISLQKQCRKDLEWIMNSPPLFAGLDGLRELFRTSQSSHEQFESTQLSLTPLRARRVGLYFESLVEILLAKILKLDMEAKHLQVFNDGRTIGEIDFSVRDHKGIRWRLECTVKYYLHHPKSKSIHGSSFIGPDPRDCFERKYHHLLDSQLRLNAPNLKPPDCSLPVSRGILFYHIDDPMNPQRPKKANPNHLRGIWMKASEWIRFSNTNSGIDRIIHLPKPYWISGISNPGLSSRELNMQEATTAFQIHFKDSQSPLMLSLMESGNVIDDTMRRCIIVPENWPYDI